MKSWAGHWVRPHSSGKPLALSNKVKTGLDETRTLILGGQILLGFQFNGAFEVRFDSLPPLAKVLDAIALGVMLASVGLLIAPSAFHRIADRGESTGRMQVLTGRCAEAALLPFSIALGLDLAIALARTFGGVAVGLVAGAVFAAIALGSWYGLGEVMKQHQGADERLIPTLTERDSSSHLSCSGRGPAMTFGTTHWSLLRFGSNAANLCWTAHWQSDCVASKDFQPQRHRVHRVVAESFFNNTPLLLCDYSVILCASVVEYYFTVFSVAGNAEFRLADFAMGHHR